MVQFGAKNRPDAVYWTPFNWSIFGTKPNHWTLFQACSQERVQSKIFVRFFFMSVQKSPRCAGNLRYPLVSTREHAIAETQTILIHLVNCSVSFEPEPTVRTGHSKQPSEMIQFVFGTEAKLTKNHSTKACHNQIAQYRTSSMLRNHLAMLSKDLGWVIS